MSSERPAKTAGQSSPAIREFVRFIETCYKFLGSFVTLVPRKALSESIQKRRRNAQTMAERASAG
jgi:hypothetical protein